MACHHCIQRAPHKSKVICPLSLMLLGLQKIQGWFILLPLKTSTGSILLKVQRTQVVTLIYYYRLARAAETRPAYARCSSPLGNLHDYLTMCPIHPRRTLSGSTGMILLGLVMSGERWPHYI